MDAKATNGSNSAHDPLLFTLQCHHLTDIYHSLKANDIDLSMLKNDLKQNEVKPLCDKLQLTQIQRSQFQNLIHALHAPIRSPLISAAEEHRAPETMSVTETGTEMKMTVAVIGDANVGKTSLIRRYIHDLFHEISEPTIEVDTHSATEILSDDTRMQLTIFDTAGQEKYQSVARTYYRRADAIIVCFDVVEDVTYIHCQQWITQIEEYGQEDPVVIFVGCKGDISQYNRVSVEEKAQEIMEKYGKMYCECSALTGENIKKVFFTAAELVMIKRREREKSKAVTTNKKSTFDTLEMKYYQFLRNTQTTQLFPANGNHDCCVLNYM